MTLSTHPSPVIRFREIALALLPGAHDALFSGDDDTLHCVSLTFPDPADWRTMPDETVLPAGRLERSLENLGWTVEGALSGPILDDVTEVTIRGRGDGSCAVLTELWRAAEVAWEYLRDPDGEYDLPLAGDRAAAAG